MLVKNAQLSSANSVLRTGQKQERNRIKTGKITGQKSRV